MKSVGIKRYVEVVQIKTNWPKWWQRRLVPTHLYATLIWVDGRSAIDSVILVDPSAAHFEITPLSRNELRYRARNTCVVSCVTVEYPESVDTEPSMSFELFTCVAVIKRMLGIHKWWILTPGQLMRYLDAN